MRRNSIETGESGLVGEGLVNHSKVQTPIGASPNPTPLQGSR